MRAKMTVNPNVNEYGNGKATIYDFGILDEKGRLSLPEGILAAYVNGKYVSTGAALGSYGFTAKEKKA